MLVDLARCMTASHLERVVRTYRQANCCCLCRVHHRLLHEGGFTVVARASGRFEFYRSDGTRLPHIIDILLDTDGLLRDHQPSSN